MTMAFSLGPLILLIATVAFVVSLIDRRTRPWALGLLLVGGLAIGLLAMWRTHQRGGQATATIYQVSQASIPSRFPSAHQPAIPAPPTPSAAQPVVSEPRAAKTATDELSKATDQPDKTKHPDWMKQPPTKQGEVYTVPIASGTYSDPAVREQMLDVKMLAAANRYIDEILYRQGGVADVVAFDPDYLQNFVHDRTASSAGDEAFVRLEFNQRFRDEVDRRYRQFVSMSRLDQLCVVAIAIFGVLGGLYAYLRFTNQRSPAAAEPVQTPALRN